MVLLRAAFEVGITVAGPHRDEEGHDDARHRGVDAAVVEQEPDGDGRHEIEGHALFAQFVHQEHSGHEDQSDGQ